MDITIFNRLEEHVFDEGNPWDIWEDKSVKPNRLPIFASWAIYDEQDRTNQKIIKDKKVELLNDSIVFVGLNFSASLRQDWMDWQNIHGNFNVRWLLDNEDGLFNAKMVEKYKGAYITDIIKNHTGPIANEVMAGLTKEEILKNIGWFFEEIELLGSATIEMYLFGRDVEGIFRDYVLHHKKFPEFRAKVKKCQRIQHYSGQNPWFRRYAPGELGLDASSNRNPDILWNDLRSLDRPLPEKSEKDQESFSNGMRFYPDIRTAAAQNGLGNIVINRKNWNRLHHRGITDKNEKVWLPIVDTSDDYWDNIVVGNLILQCKKAAVPSREWDFGPLRESAWVITRTFVSSRDAYGYENIGKYCPVLFDVTRYLTIHAKFGLPETEGKVMLAKKRSGLTWLSGFAADEDEAEAKIKELLQG